MIRVKLIGKQWEENKRRWSKERGTRKPLKELNMVMEVDRYGRNKKRL